MLQVQQIKLSEEEKADLREVVLSDGYKAILKTIELFAVEQEQQIFKLNLTSLEDEKILIQTKLRAEGSRRLATALIVHLEKIRVATLSHKEGALSSPKIKKRLKT